MIIYKSKKSNKFHRYDCRYVDRIEAKSLVPFFYDGNRASGFSPCKYCCSLKNMFEHYKPFLQSVFANQEITAKYTTQYVEVRTKWYEWKISLNQSNQMLELYRKITNGENQEEYLIRCREVGDTEDLDTVMRYIVAEEKVARYPEKYRKQALQIEQYAKEKEVQIEFVDNELYVLTDIAVWKIVYRDRSDWYQLLHCPFDGESLTMEQAKEAHYHAQMDVSRNMSPYKHLQYIVKHDIAKRIEQVDYKQLPKKTKKEKKYFRQAEKRAKRNSVSRVFDIFAELESKGELTGLAIG